MRLYKLALLDKATIDGIDINGKHIPMLEINSIQTVFAKSRRIGVDELVVSYDKNITPEQSALQDGLNFRQYPTIQELSDGKGTTLSGDKQGYDAESSGNISHRTVEDEAVIDELERGGTIKAYCTMQIIDGELYSPMATKVGGKPMQRRRFGLWEQADENPDKAVQQENGTWAIVIDKGQGKGTLNVAYNPYNHVSRSVLNDQFTSAHVRPNLVTVEVEVPVSELTSGYKADKAKDAVGEMSWHTGPVQ